MKNTSTCIASIIGGMIVGSALAMLFTPKSGPELRRTIREVLDREIDRVRCKCDEKID